jgi:hypothetical protein
VAGLDVAASVEDELGHVFDQADAVGAGEDDVGEHAVKIRGNACHSEPRSGEESLKLMLTEAEIGEPIAALAEKGSRDSSAFGLGMTVGV